MTKVEYDARLDAVYAAGRQMTVDAVKPGSRHSVAICPKHDHWSGSISARAPAA
jgi:hypothetical protein